LTKPPSRGFFVAQNRTMAARTRSVTLDDSWRARIQTSMLINRLHDNAFGLIELTEGQRKSIEILLRKSAPDLQAVTISGDEANPLAIVISAGQSLEHKFARLLSGPTEETPAEPDRA
jgi:hypothetical protein